MKEVALIGATCYGNRGAEAMLSTAIGELLKSDPNIQFNVFSYYPAKDSSLINNESVRIYSSTPFYLVSVLGPMAALYALLAFLRVRWFNRIFPASVRALARSKVLICLAGVSFIDGREKFLPFNIATILPAMLLRVPVVKFAQAVGPFCSPLNQFAARHVLARCNRVFARGDKTLSNLADAFKDVTFYERADDVAFLFQPEYTLSKCEASIEAELSELQRLRASARVVGVCPSIVIAKRRQAEGQDYAKEMAAIVKRLAESGYTVALFPNATRGDDMDKMHNNDLPLLNDIIERVASLSPGKLVAFPDSINAGQIHQIIRACDIVVTSRFHAMVGALLCETPVLVIGWSHKYLEVMALFGQEDMVMDHIDLDANVMCKQVDSLLANITSRRESISKALPAVKRRSRLQVEYVNRHLDNVP
jgi:polysaccharide pyruvyl transferase WcaK-like protein